MAGHLCTQTERHFCTLLARDELWMWKSWLKGGFPDSSLSDISHHYSWPPGLAPTGPHWHLDLGPVVSKSHLKNQGQDEDQCQNLHL